ncbi:uncharacterized protein FSUBG_13341 [Fusarium subglutinans]|uniref:2EXR domain-containing protein n=1 Tax=Gibberella subglutinans TaxID=42677 RepID=A0A8H5NYU8_GIBSU|nr:uncharacterized protein FSUBG_13341 [Fusarium subglutinans]KAF5580645.1 hypothetical protein FSUBG_13341 [Fusarium subglutinans]
MSDLSIPTHTPKSNEMATFPQFAKLPIELRDMIWEEALKKERVLSMHVWTLGEDCSDTGRTMELLHGRPLETEVSDLINSPTTPRLTDGRETKVNAGSKKEYSVMVDDKAAISKLFRVNAESRQAAKRFYRVHIPCTYMKPGFYEKGTLYLRPELDTIRMGLTEGFGRFAHCVWALDRLHVGLVNLAPDLKVKLSGRNGLAWEYDSFPEDDVEGELWKEGLGRLQNVSFQDTIPGCLDPRWADLRMLPQPLDPISVGPPGFHDRWAKANTPQYLPIEGMRLSAWAWFWLLTRKGIKLSPEVNYGCMLSHGDTLHQCLPNRTKKWQCAADLFIQDFRAKGTEVVPGYWLFPMDYLAFVKDDEGDWVVDRNNAKLEQMKSSFEVCIHQLTAYKEQTGTVDCRKRHLWKTS